MKTQKKDQSRNGNGHSSREIESALHRHPFFNTTRSITPIWPSPYQGFQQSISPISGGSPISSALIGAQPFINPYFHTFPVSQFAHTQPFGSVAPGSGFFPPIQHSLTNAEIIPAANICEDEESFFIQLTVPGYKSDECKIKVKDRTLFIKGQRETENDKDGTFYSVKEYRNTFFERFFQLSDEVETDQIEANCVDGILTVTLPKKSSESLKEKEIEVGEEFLV